jgi:hypothetical protein
MRGLFAGVPSAPGFGRTDSQIQFVWNLREEKYGGVRLSISLSGTTIVVIQRLSLNSGGNRGQTGRYPFLAMFCVVREDRLSGIAALGYVVRGVDGYDTWRSCHKNTK